MEKKYLKYKFKYNYLKKNLLGGGEEERLIKQIKYEYLSKIKQMIDTDLTVLEEQSSMEHYVFSLQEFGDEILIIITNTHNNESQYYSSIKDKMVDGIFCYIKLDIILNEYFANINTNLEKLFKKIPSIENLQSLQNFLDKHSTNILVTIESSKKILNTIQTIESDKQKSAEYLSHLLATQKDCSKSSSTSVKFVATTISSNGVNKRVVLNSLQQPDIDKELEYTNIVKNTLTIYKMFEYAHHEIISICDLLVLLNK